MKKMLKCCLLAWTLTVMTVLSSCGIGGGSGYTATDDYAKDNQARTWKFYNMDVMQKCLKDSHVYTYDSVREAVAENETITDEYSGYFYRFLDLMEEAYPDMNLYCLYKNMQSLTFAPRSAEQMEQIFGGDCIGNYKAGENKLYFNYEAQMNTEYLLFHEMCHMVTNYWGEQKLYKVYFDFDTHAGFVAEEEGLNSIFLENITGYSIEKMSYQIPANHLRVLLEYTDHTLEEILKHDSWYFEDIIDETCGEDIGDGCYNAALVNQMIDAGYYSEDDRYDIDRDYADYCTGKIYFTNNLRADMNREELISCYEALVLRLTDGVWSGSDIVDIHDFSDLQAAFFETAEAVGITDSEIPDASELTLTYEFPQKTAE